jgi:2-hydroxychromene-2-carboxylate isomerase
MSKTVVTLYSDYKSPYAYLAKDPAYDLERDYRIVLDILPYSLEIAKFLGGVEDRNDHQWRRVRYSYMDARRLANARGLTVLGPRKVNDSRLIHTAMLLAKRADVARPGVFRAFHDLVFLTFWKRELDLESRSEVEGILKRVDLDAGALSEWVSGEGGAWHDRIKAEAEAEGVFGVPTFVVNGELFWGSDRIPMVRDKLRSMGLGR